MTFHSPSLPEDIANRLFPSAPVVYDGPLPWTTQHSGNDLSPSYTYHDEPNRAGSSPNSQPLTSDESEDEFEGFESEDSWSSGSQDNQHPSIPFVETFPGAGKGYGKARNTLDDIDVHDMYPEERKECVFYPFKSEEDFEMAAWLLETGISMARINAFLKIPMVCSFPYSNLQSL